MFVCSAKLSGQLGVGNGGAGTTTPSLLRSSFRRTLNKFRLQQDPAGASGTSGETDDDYGEDDDVDQENNDGDNRSPASRCDDQTNSIVFCIF